MMMLRYRVGVFVCILCALVAAGVLYGDETMPAHVPARFVHNPRGRCTPPLLATHRVAIAFFGISRNINLTLPLIHKYVFQELKRAGVRMDVYWHTLIKPNISNVHTREKAVTLNPNDVQRVQPCLSLTEDEASVKRREFKSYREGRREGFSKGLKHAIEKYDFFDRYFNDSFESVKNMLCAFYSQERLSGMIEYRMKNRNVTYDAILLLRPDTAPIFRDIDIARYIPSIRCGELSGIVWTPGFQLWKGLNDRFAFGDVPSMLTYMRRGAMYKQGHNNLTSGSGEHYLKKYLELHNITNRFSYFRLLRVRADGTVPVEDCSDPAMLGDFGEERMSKCVRILSNTSCKMRDPMQC